MHENSGGGTPPCFPLPTPMAECFHENYKKDFAIIRQLRITSFDKRASMHAPRFFPIKQPSKQPLLREIKASIS